MTGSSLTIVMQEYLWIAAVPPITTGQKSETHPLALVAMRREGGRTVPKHVPRMPDALVQAREKTTREGGGGASTTRDASSSQHRKLSCSQCSTLFCSVVKNRRTWPKGHLAERGRTQCARVFDEFTSSARCVTVFGVIQKLVMAGLVPARHNLNSSPPPE